MERWRVCPECGSTNIRCDIGVTSRSSDPRFANTLVYGPGPLGLGKSAAVDTFVCGDCGIIRSYVSDPKVLDFINENWSRADTLVTPEEEALRQKLERELQGKANDDYEE